MLFLQQRHGHLINQNRFRGTYMVEKNRKLVYNKH